MPPPTTRTLVIGGARSGKSATAERQFGATEEVVYVATAYPADLDAEWADRVHRHQERRPATWRTLETIDLAPLLTTSGPPLLVDCLTLWLTRVMDGHHGWDDEAWTAGGRAAVEAEIDVLVESFRESARRVVAVTNELGQGVVPESASVRRFRDLMGTLNTRVAAECGEVLWCVAGRVMRL